MNLSLRHLVEQLSFLTEHSTAFLEYETGEIYVVTDEEVHAAQKPDPDKEHTGEELEIFEQINELVSSDAFLKLPTRSDLGEMDILTRFCRSIEKPALRAEFVEAISGDNAYARFRELRQKYRLEDQWFDFWETNLAENAKSWLAEKDVPYMDDISASLDDDDQDQVETEPIDALSINRSVAIVKPTEVFYNWVMHGADVPDSFTLGDLRTDCLSFLIPQCNDPAEAELFIKEVYQELFELELESWNANEAAWPVKRDYAAFQEWFDVEIHSMVVDITGDELRFEDLE